MSFFTRNTQPFSYDVTESLDVESCDDKIREYLHCVINSLDYATLNREKLIVHVLPCPTLEQFMSTIMKLQASLESVGYASKVQIECEEEHWRSRNLQ